MTDAKEVGVGNPAEENKRTVIGQRDFHQKSAPNTSIFFRVARFFYKAVSALSFRELWRFWTGVLPGGRANNFARNVNNRRRLGRLGSFPEHDHGSYAAGPGRKHIGYGKQLDDKRGQQEHVKPNCGRSQNHSDHVQDLVGQGPAQRPKHQLDAIRNNCYAKRKPYPLSGQDGNVKPTRYLLNHASPLSW